MHAHHYRTPDPLVGKRVLVLGIGNSACDIAVESSRVAERTGDITVRPNIDRFEGSKVMFTDGSSGEYDVVVYCPGYKVSFPFFTGEVIRAEDNHVDLCRRVVHPDHPGLYFVGRIQPLGAIMPLAEAQAEWLCDLVTGSGALPSEQEMRRQIATYDANLRKRFVSSKRHTIEVDFHSYRAEIHKERKRRSPSRRAALSSQAARFETGTAALNARLRSFRVGRWRPPQRKAPRRPTTSGQVEDEQRAGRGGDHRAGLVGHDSLGEPDPRARLDDGADGGQPSAARAD